MAYGDGEKPEIKSAKKVAKDGSKRGLKRKGSKNKATLLLEQMQHEVQEKYGIRNFDPVVMLALIGCEALEARWIEEENDEGKKVKILIPPDRALAVNAFGKAAPYVRSTLKQIELSDKDEGPIDADVVGAKQKLARMAGIAVDDVLGEGDDD